MMRAKAFWQKLLLAALAGGLAPLALSPLEFWPLGILSVLGIFTLLQTTSPIQSFQLGWAYGLGFFGIGASWIYVSINVYGNASPLLAGLLTLLFVALLALLFACQCWCYRRFFNHSYQALSFAAIWVLFEWLRSWLFTGFPWLYLGYAHLHAPLAGFAPLIGVMGISFIVALSAGIIHSLISHFNSRSHFSSLIPALLLLWLLPLALIKISWTTEQVEKEFEVSLVQANIDQKQKFDSAFLQASFDRYESLSQPLWDSDIVIWPETAIPLDLQQAENILGFYESKTLLNNSSLVTGIFAREDGYTYNSIISLGTGTTAATGPNPNIYHKQKLVPFGEYQPLPSLTGPILEIFSLPMASVRKGSANQSMLNAAGLSLAPFICYEVVFPDFVRANSKNADFLVTISNDTWFGASFGPLQHLQMAAMRALENGRYMVRATSNGVSAIIDEKGHILQRTQQFQMETLTGQVKVFNGRTPFSYSGSYPLLLLCTLILLISYRKQHL